jgi:hypothetical protein
MHGLIDNITVLSNTIGVSLSTLVSVGHADHPFDAIPSSPYLTRRQTAAYLQVSEKWLAQSGRASGPTFHKFGNQARYHFDDIHQWARQQKVKL